MYYPMILMFLVILMAIWIGSRTPPFLYGANWKDQAAVFGLVMAILLLVAILSCYINSLSADHRERYKSAFYRNGQWYEPVSK